MGAGAKVWLYDKDAAEWRPAYCDSDGKIRISDADPFTIAQDTPEDLKHLPHGYYAAGPSYLPLKVKSDGTLMIEMAERQNLDDLNDVDVPSPTDGYVLYWDAATSLWKCKSVSGTKIQDADGDTSWDVEQTADEDKVHGKVKGVEAFLLDDAGILTLAKQSGAKAHKATGNQTVHDSTDTKVILEVEDHDIQGEYDPTSYRFTAKAAGLYLIVGQTFYTATVDLKAYQVKIFKNGADLATIQRVANGTADGLNQCTTVAFLAVGDYIELYAVQYSGADASLQAAYNNNWLAVAKIA